MNQDNFQAIQNMLHRWDELTDSICLISGPGILMSEKQFNQTETRIEEMRQEEIKIRQTIKGFIAGNRQLFWD